MTESQLDPLRDRMIAALYGELSTEECCEVEARIRANPRLLAEWNELREAREFLRAAGEEEPVDEFDFSLPALPDASRPVRRGWFERRFLRAFLPGFGLAAAAMLVLIVAGFRADRVDGALLLRFGSGPVGPAPPALTESRMDGEPHMSPVHSLDGTTTLTMPISSAPGTPPFAGDEPARLDPDDYLTREEFAFYARGMNALVEQLVGNQDDRRRAEMVYITRALYEEIARRQNERYDQLDARIQQVWFGMAGLSREGVEIVPGGDTRESSRPRTEPAGGER